MKSRYAPDPWEPNLPFDWATGGRQLSEEERQIARRLARASAVEADGRRRTVEKVEEEA